MNAEFEKMVENLSKSKTVLIASKRHKKIHSWLLENVGLKSDDFKPLMNRVLEAHESVYIRLAP